MGEPGDAEGSSARFAASSPTQLTRRDLLARAGTLGLGAAIAAALPVAARMAVPERAARPGPRRRPAAGVLRHDRPRQAGPRPADRARQPDPPEGDRRRRPRARRRLHRRAGAGPQPADRLHHARARVPRRPERPRAGRGRRVHRSRLRGPRARLPRRARLLEPRPRRLGGRRGDPVHRLLRRRQHPQRDREDRGRLRGDGPSRAPAPKGYRRLLLRRSEAQPRPDRQDGRTLALMAERVDVCIVGSGFGGSIAAWRLAELYRAAEQDASVSCSSAACARATRSFASRWTSTTSPTSTALIQGQGAQIVVANLVGGGSNLYLAASLRSPSRPSSAPTSTPTTARAGACGRGRSAAGALNRYYARAEAGLRVRQPSWKQVSKSGGVWAAMLREAGPHLRPGAAGDRLRALRGRQVVLHGLRLRRQELADHQLPRLGRAPRGRGAAAGAGRTRSRPVERPPVPLARPRRRGSIRRPSWAPSRSRSSARSRSSPPARWARRRS